MKYIQIAHWDCGLIIQPKPKEVTSVEKVVPVRFAPTSSELEIILCESKQIAKKASPICFERIRILQKFDRRNLGKRNETRLARVFGQRGQCKKA